MRKINCIAIDDEPIALFIIKQFCDRKGGMEITTFCDPRSADELFKNRKTIAIRDNTPPSATRGKAVVGNGKLVYHKISSGETLGSIAEKYKVRVKDIQNWNGLRNTKITAGKRLKIYK